MLFLDCCLNKLHVASMHLRTDRVKQGGYVTWFFGRVHTFLNARFMVRKLTFLRLYPIIFYKTKCIAYANMSTFHKTYSFFKSSVQYLQKFEANV